LAANLVAALLHGREALGVRDEDGDTLRTKAR